MSPRLGPIKRPDFIARLRALGFEGPVAGTNHTIMMYGRKRLAIPSDDEYSPELLQLLLREASEIIGRRITRDEWARLKRARPEPR